MSRIRWFNLVRAFGLLLVLGYHLFYNMLPGGFLGVDIFFTFSGFLITALFIEEFRTTNGINLLKFYKRRIQRIMLPMVLMVVFTLPFTLLISPDFSVGIAKQLAAVLSFTTNWLYIINGFSYEAQLIPSLYSHTWSLAVIMQFYIIWGLICALFAVLSKKLAGGKKSSTYFKALVIIVSGVSAALSYIYMRSLYNADVNLNIIYFNTLSRLFPFLIGSIGAAIWGMQENQDTLIKEYLSTKHTKAISAFLIVIILSALSLILFNFSKRSFDDGFIYRYGFLFTSLLTVALIYATHGLHILTPPDIKEPKPLVVVSEMSYDLFLYHWPFYVIFSALILNNTAASLATLAITLVFSAIMVYVAEQVLLLRNETRSLRGKRIVGAAILVSVAFGYIAVSKAPTITGIEEDFAASYITRNAQDIISLKRGIDAINQTPVNNIID